MSGNRRICSFAHARIQSGHLISHFGFPDIFLQNNPGVGLEGMKGPVKKVNENQYVNIIII